MNSERDDDDEAGGYLRDPLADWGNDDLLISRATREAALHSDPDLFRVIDWPEVRALFVTHDDRAQRLKRASRRDGVSSAVLTGAGSAALALAPVLWPDNRVFTESATVLALLATVAGTALGVWHWLFGRMKQSWLNQRHRAERLRQFYFQFTISHLALAARATSDDLEFERWKTARAKSLERFTHRFAQDQRHNSARLETDHSFARVWIEDEWRNPPVDLRLSGRDSVNLDRLLARLSEQRIRIQRQYAAATLEPTVHSPHVRRSIFDRSGDVFTSLLVVAALCSGISIFSGWNKNVPLALIGAAGAVGLLMRALAQGLNVASDADRMEWYFSAIDDCAHRFDQGDSVARIGALRDLEVCAYREMLQFLRAHRRDKFVV